MADDPLDKLVQKIRETKPQGKVTRVTRSFSAVEPQYTTLLRYCRSVSIPVSNVLNDLIAAFLEKVRDDIPPEVRTPVKDED